MKVLLIYPPVTVSKHSKVRSHAPMGLMYLAAYIRKFGYEVKLLDALAEGGNNSYVGGLERVGMSFEQVSKIIKEFSPEVVGISVMFTAYYDDALKLAKKIKKRFPEMVIVMGGSHISVDPKICIRDKGADFAVYGEGEATFVKLLKMLKADRNNFSEINGLAYKSGRRVLVNPPAELIKDLDEIPFPDWDMLDLSKYDLGDQTQMMTQIMRKPCFTVETSRGCPNHCMYCSSFAVWRHCWRGRTPKNVVDEIENLVTKYGAREIAFYDDSMSVNKERFVGICKEIIKRKLDIKWSPPNGIAHWTLDKEMLNLMKASGCYRITFGIESGDPEIRRWVGKPYDLSQAKDLIKYANDIGLWTTATNIIGFPYETKEQMRHTLEYAIDSGVDIALFFRLGLRPGAPVYDIFKKEGWLPKNQKLLYMESVSLDTKYVKGKEIVEYQKKMYEEFFRKRWVRLSVIKRIFKKIKNIEDFVYAIKQLDYVYRIRNRLAYAFGGLRESV